MFQGFIAFLGRVCISLIFLLSSIQEILNWHMMEQYTYSLFSNLLSIYQNQPMVSSVVMELLPWVPLFLMVAVACKVLGSLLLIMGWKVRLGAFLLIVFLVPATFLAHHFWTESGEKRGDEMIALLKNVGIFGGLLLLLAFGSGGKQKGVHAGKGAEA